MSSNDQNKNQKNFPTIDSSLDPEQSGDKISSEVSKNSASLSDGEVLGITGTAVAGAAALGIGVKAAVNNNAAPVNVGKPEEVVSVNDDNINKVKTSESFVYVDSSNAKAGKTNNKKDDITKTVPNNYSVKQGKGNSDAIEKNEKEKIKN